MIVIKPGIYRHYKNKEYRVIAVGKHSETLEDFVLYEALYDNTLSHFWIRPLSMFADMVTVDGKEVSRFEFLRDS